MNSFSFDSALQAVQVDDESVAHVALQHPLIRVVDLLDGYHLDVGGDSVLRAMVEHLLRLGDTADRRALEAPARESEALRPRRARMSANGWTDIASGGAPTITIVPRGRSMPRYLL